MHNSRIRAIGTWIGDLLYSELNALAFGFLQAINGDEGGVWAPQALIDIEGAGLSVTGPTYFQALDALVMPFGSTFTVNGELDVFGTTNVPSTGSVVCQSGSTTTFDPASTTTVAANGQVAFASTSTLAFQTLLGQPHPCQWTGSPTFLGSFSCTASGGSAEWVFQSGTTLTTACTVTQQFGNNANINCPVLQDVGGTVTRACGLTLSGATGAIGWRRGTTSDSASSYDASRDSWAVPNLSSGWTYTLLNTGAFGSVTAFVGMRVHFHQRSGAVVPIIKNESGGTISPAITVPWWIDFYFDGSNWQIESYGNGAQGFTNLS